MKSNNIFMETISPYFDELETICRERANKMNLMFDEDVFLNTIEQCNKKITEKLSKEDTIKYFWTAFKNNTYRELLYARNKYTDELNEDMDIIEDDYDAHEDFNNVSKMIINKFGDKLYQLFALHANGKPYKELQKLTTISNLKYKFRCIRDYIRKNYKREWD